MYILNIIFAILDLRHLLEENEKKMQNMTMTWEQRLEEARYACT